VPTHATVTTAARRESPTFDGGSAWAKAAAEHIGGLMYTATRTAPMATSYMASSVTSTGSGL